MDFALQDGQPDPGAESDSGGDVEQLSVREREVARLIAQGQSNRRIAEGLVLSVKTVESHIKNVSKKLQVRTRAEIAVWAARQGLI